MNEQLCAHCGVECAGEWQDSAGEIICNYCKTNLMKMETAPKNNVQEGKARLSLLPLDVLSKYLVPAYEEGIKKYQRESWRGGFHTSVMIDTALRHIEDFYWKGADVDVDSSTGKHPLTGAIFCLISILHALDTRPELDDRILKEPEPDYDQFNEELTETERPF